ncbi:MAG TPA: NAD-binding protein, partial [Candidatus Limnocylindrales bacterium]|nr:NAD-binding protein [Candidatus Limnocylindrales bacterium]
MSRPFGTLLATPLLRRIAWYGQRVASQLDRRFFLALGTGALVFVAAAAGLITLLEKPWTVASLFDGVNWGVATILGSGDAGFVVSPGGRIVAWLLQLFGVAIIGTITGALVALVIDFLLKEGQGLGASGYRDHIVVCGWNATARDLLAELKGDDYAKKVVVLAKADKNPAGEGVYFVSGDPSEAVDLRRAGLEDASAAVVFP